MDLQRLKWTKNVKRGDKAWAYSQFKVADLFKLAWKDDEVDASKPQKDDLILLRVVNLDFPPLSDEDVVLNAEGLFLELDKQEATHE